MLDRLRMWIGIQIARFRLRKSRDAVISFNNAVNSARRALLIMPLKRREFLPTVMVIDFLKKRFPEENITVISDDHGREVVRMLIRSHFIHLMEEEITPFFLPSPGLVRRIQEREYDLVIDLNLDFVLPSAYICKESNAPVRIGFSRDMAESFYNFQIQPDPTLERKYLYDRMARFLQMF
ncbi:MAG: glycosyltransferase family 9 protein [Bacteroidota bacterium]